MLRDFVTNKWFLGGVGFLIVLAVACVLWYQHDIAPEKKAAAEAEKLLRQSQIAKQSEMDSEAEQVADASLESEAPAAEKPMNRINAEVAKNADPGKPLANLMEQQQTENTQKVRVSPHGLGPYPKMPDGWAQGFFDRELTLEEELMGRVQIKLHEEGIPNYGLKIDLDKGLVFPFAKNQVYATFVTSNLPTLGTTKTMTSMFGDAFAIEEIKANARDRDPLIPVPIETDIPADIEILSESDGFDPYAFLNLKRQSP